MAETKASAASLGTMNDTQESSRAFARSAQRSGSLRPPTVDGKSSYSASDFALKDDSLTADEPGTEHWLWERATIRLGRIKTSGTSASEIHINEMIDQYDKTFEFAWPKAWSTKAGRKQRTTLCDSIYQKLLELLFSQYAEYSELADQPPKGVRELDKDTFACLDSRISVFLAAVAMTSGRMHQGRQNIAVNEAERRTAIDLMLQTFCCSADMAGSDAFFLESIIRLSSNKAVEGCFDDAKQTQIWHSLAIQQATTIDDYQDKFPHSWAIAYQTLEKAAKKENNLSESIYKNPLSAESRKREPRQGTADSVVCARYPLFRANGEPPKSQSTTSNRSKWSTIFQKYVPGFKTKCDGESDISPDGTVPKQQKLEKVKLREPPEAITSAHLGCKLCLFVTERLPALNKSVSSSLPLSPHYALNEMLIPTLYAEFKRNYGKKSPHKGSNQCHLYCISTVDFLAALGIVDFPVFGIITAGEDASVIMAWRSSVLPERKEKEKDKASPEHGLNVVIDEHLVSFNLAEPLDAYRFVISLHRIYKYQQKLRDLLDAVGHKNLIDKLESPAFGNWAMPPKTRNQKAK